MRNRKKRSCVAFLPCLSLAILEDRLVLSGGLSPVIPAIASHAAVIGAIANPAAPASNSATQVAVSSVQQAGSIRDADTVIAGTTNLGSTIIGSTGTGVVTGIVGTGTGTFLTGSGALPTGTGSGIFGSSDPAASAFDNALEDSTAALQDFYGVPATVAVDLPSGGLPGIAGTPHSAIGYWGYNDAFDNGFYDFVSETVSSTPYFNSVNRGFATLPDSFVSTFVYTQATPGPGAQTETGDHGMAAGGMGAGPTARVGKGIGGTGVGDRAGSRFFWGEISRGENPIGAPPLEPNGKEVPPSQPEGKEGVAPEPKGTSGPVAPAAKSTGEPNAPTKEKGSATASDKNKGSIPVPATGPKGTATPAKDLGAPAKRSDGTSKEGPAARALESQNS